MAEVPTLQEKITVISKDNPLPPSGTYKFIYIGAGKYFGKQYPDTFLLGPMEMEHTDLAKGFFKTGSTSEIQGTGFTDTGLLFVRNKKYHLAARSGGISVLVNGKPRESIYLTDEAAEELHHTTEAYLKRLFPDIIFPKGTN